MTITATHINYFHICQRKLWLFSNGVHMEHTSNTVYDGKLLHEISYPQRSARHSEVELSALLENGISISGKLDFYEAVGKVIHEIKRSNKAAEAHTWQCKFYIWLLELNGIKDAVCTLEFPAQRQNTTIVFGYDDRVYLQQVVFQVNVMLHSDNCPPRLNTRICKSCSYYELCYTE